MIASMTAFVRKTMTVGDFFLEWEIKSVNHRYLDVQLKLPDVLKSLEFQLREPMRQVFSRGKVDVTVRFSQSFSRDALKINESLAVQIIELSEKISAKIKHTQPLNPIDILRWPGVIEDACVFSEENAQAVLCQWEDFLIEFSQCRQREGAAIGQVLSAKAKEADLLAHEMRALQPGVLELQRVKLQSMVDRLGVSIDRDRFEQELVYMIKKMDIEEEIDRLKVHINEITKTIAAGGAMGRKLDFLAQECLREANTLSAKVADISLAGLGVNLKLVIEQFREQSQNIE